MKILFASYTFAPNVGGIESVSAVLAEKFADAGHEVELITETPEERNSLASTAVRKFRLTRQPSFWKLLQLLLWCDLLFQNNISLRSLLPALLLKKRVIVVHQTWLRHTTGQVGWINRLKRALLPHLTNVAISRAILDDINVLARVIGNPYDDRIFQLFHDVARDKTLVFLGRLVSDKGVDLLLQALKMLQRDHLKPDLTIVGSGPEEEKLRRLARELGVDSQVMFAGQQSGNGLARLLNRHQIMVVPSRWPEPFGIVALEGIACGCALVGSSGGGLPEAIGHCGLTFENGNARALAENLKDVLLQPELAAKFRAHASTHLQQFKTDNIVAAYRELLEAVDR